MLIVVAAIGGWLALRRPTASHTVVSPTAPTAHLTQISQGTSNQNLTNDLTTLNANLATESQDSTASDAALNDQTQAIAVPSN